MLHSFPPTWVMTAISFAQKRWSGSASRHQDLFKKGTGITLGILQFPTLNCVHRREDTVCYRKVFPKYHFLTDTLKYAGSISNSEILNSISKNKELYQIKEWLFDFKIWATVFYESLEWSRMKDEVNSRDEKDEMKHCEDFLCIHKPLVPWNDLISLLCWLYCGILRYLNTYYRTLCFLFLKIQKVIKRRKTVTRLWNKKFTECLPIKDWTKPRGVISHSNLLVKGHQLDGELFRLNAMVHAHLSVHPTSTLLMIIVKFLAFRGIWQTGF